ncbi:MAG: 16S rRNA (guanine(966)-N(2))-methyltransferase RsmD [Firmicutes bacterium]|nr:16S rRNA (guanine(966)-N(2))-methyltransferase RsmD [Dethiobacter sp.]MBS3888590.1 16S rRNA (guanine(966)-N(2))-methyltransferase RsmD [Bacillota bacterium]MBS4054154.1 16S rRNA (guanine(966)-N(2))-methyltransferase RsmD [Thermaerobacter sp.]
MRVIAGTLGGRAIGMKDSLPIRPTSDKARGAVFSSLAPRIAGAKFLDIFAGTGAMGIEAISRGAHRVTAVELSPQVARLIKENLLSLGITSDEFEVKVGSFQAVLPILAAETYDLIFADPPYGQGYPAEVLRLIAHHDLLKTEGLLVIEHFSKESVPQRQGKLRLFKIKTYGQTQMSFFMAERECT